MVKSFQRSKDNKKLNIPNFESHPVSNFKIKTLGSCRLNKFEDVCADLIEIYKISSSEIFVKNLLQKMSVTFLAFLS